MRPIDRRANRRKKTGRRPEDAAPGSDADAYYDRATTATYTAVNVATQRDITAHALTLVEPLHSWHRSVRGPRVGLGPGGLVADVGCGSGLSGEEISRRGYAWVGVDASEAMLERAVGNHSCEGERAAWRDGVRGGGGGGGGGGGRGGGEMRGGAVAAGAVARVDFAQGLPLRAGAFDALVSASAAQWLCVGAPEEKEEKLRRFFGAVRRCLKPGALAALQVYPANVEDTWMMEACLRASGLVGGATTGFPHATRARKIFMCASRPVAEAAGRDETNRTDWMPGMPPPPEDEPSPPWVPSRGAMPRCPLAWPHATSCCTAWRRLTGGIHAPSTTDQSDAVSRRAEKEHIAHARRLLRLLRRARASQRLSERPPRDTGAGESTSPDGPGGGGHAAPLAFDVRELTPPASGERTHPSSVTSLERVVRDGTVCPCARAGLVVARRAAPAPTPTTSGAPSAGGRTGGREPGGKIGEGEDAEEEAGTNRGVGMYGGGETKKVDVDGKRKKPDDEGARSSLEHAVNIVARSPPRGLQLRGDGDTIAGTYQEGWLRADGAAGTPGVVAVEMTLPVGGDSGGDSVSDTVSNADADLEVGLRAARAVCGALDASGRAVICAEAVCARGSTQVWCLWWPQRPIGGDENDEGCGRCSGDVDARALSRPVDDLRRHLTEALERSASGCYRVESHAATN